MKNELMIDERLCTRCGLCARECGLHSTEKNDGRIDPLGRDCSQCYHCYTVCPAGAIRFTDGCEVPIYSESDERAVTPALLRNYLAHRRSIRSYQQRPVDDALIDELIKGACLIPSGGNAHAYEFTVLKSDTPAKAQLHEELTKIYAKRSMLLNNALLRNLAKPFVDSLTRGFLRNPEYRVRIKALVDSVRQGKDPFSHGAPVMVIIHSKSVIPTPKEDCILAGYNLGLFAMSNGLGSCFVTLAQNAINSSRKCKEILGLSPKDNINAVVVLGYPAVRHLRSAPRKEQAAVHFL